MMKCSRGREPHSFSHCVGIVTLLILKFILLHSSISTSVFSLSDPQERNFHFECAHFNSRPSTYDDIGLLQDHQDEEAEINAAVAAEASNETRKNLFEEILKQAIRDFNEIRKKGQQEAKRVINATLTEIDNISRGNGGTLCTTPSKMYKVFPQVSIGTHIFRVSREKADLIAYFIQLSREKIKPGITSLGIEELNGIFNILFIDTFFENIKFVEDSSTPSDYILHVKYKNKNVISMHKSLTELKDFPWYFSPSDGPVNISKFNLEKNTSSSSDNIQPVKGYWTWPYFKCKEQIPQNNDDRFANNLNLNGTWLVSYSVPFLLRKQTGTVPSAKAYGLLSFDIDLSEFRINQCDFEDDNEKGIDFATNPLFSFRETHKCDRNTTKCQVLKQDEQTGWRKGNYECQCNESYFAFYKQWNNRIDGFEAESKWCTTWKGNEADSFVDVVSCKKCPDGCPDCTDKHTCMAAMNPTLRLTLLCVSILCTLVAVGFIIVVCKFRKISVFKTSSPIFICIMLSGCILMYSEMIALYPVLTVASCIAVKWTRHLGFCITYTALALKLCRVYLTFRVKSAHKIKLTEKHLLHWMSPIMVIMLLYLFAWTISDPPELELMNTVDDKRFYQCVYNWWDHALAIGEVIFLAYGVWICWKIRENPDAQFISYSIYNIALVNVVMVSLHLLIVPKAGPDMKYVLAFARTQLSTTTTIGLVIGSKLIRVWRGETAGLKEIANSANGFGQDTLDLGEENLQLKEELQKMATQIEKLKFYAMCKNNPHLKQSSINTNTAEMDFGRLDSFSAL